MKEEGLIEVKSLDVTVLFATEAELQGKLKLYCHDDETQGEQGKMLYGLRAGPAWMIISPGKSRRLRKATFQWP